MLFGTNVAHMIICAGQSNAVGWNMNLAGVPANLQSAPRQYIWTGVTFQALVNGSNNGSYSSNGAKWGPEAEFGRLWTAARPSQALWIVKHAVGSTALATDWASGGTQRNSLNTAVSDAKGMLTGLGLTPKVAACLWMQGESDSLTQAHADAYETNLTAWISHVRTTYGDASTAVLIGKIKYPDGTYRATVRSAQVAVSAATSRAPLIDTDAYSMSDSAHYDVSGNVQLGADMYAAYSALVG